MRADLVGLAGRPSESRPEAPVLIGWSRRNPGDSPHRGQASLAVAVCILLLASCSGSVSQERASISAVEYAAQHGVFYAGDASHAVKPAFNVLEARREGDQWRVTIEARSLVNGSLRRAVIEVAVDARTGQAALAPSRISP